MNQKLVFHPEFCQDTLCHSDTALLCGLANQCPPELMENLARLSRLLADVQRHLGISLGGLKITSGFRGHALNTQVGGVPYSQHCLGLAADVVAPSFGAPNELALAIAQAPIEFDQLILEYNRWVHVSAPPNDQAARRDVLSIFSQTEGYIEGIVIR